MPVVLISTKELDQEELSWLDCLQKQIPKEFVLDYCKSILTSENIKHEDKNVKFIINNLYPDIRRVVNIMQKCSWNGELEIDEEKIVTNEKKILASTVEIVSVIEKGEYAKIGRHVNNIIEILAEHDVEYRNLYTELFFMKKMPAPAKIVVNKYSNDHQSCLVPHMHFMGMVFKMIKTLQEYRKAVMQQ